MCIRDRYTADGYEGTLCACNEGILEWVQKKEVLNLNLWEGDKIFFKLLEEDHPFFSLKLMYQGDTLREAVLDLSLIHISVFTNDTYVDTTKIVYDVAVEITDFAMDVLPGRKTDWILTLIVHIYLKLFLKMYIISKIALIKDLQKIIFLYQTMLHNAV